MSTPYEMMERIKELEAERDALRKDAERWRFLAPKFTGFDFDWMPSDPDARDGKSVLCFDMGREFSFSVDVESDIDAAIQSALLDVAINGTGMYRVEADGAIEHIPLGVQP